MTAVFSDNGLQIEIETVKNSDGSYSKVDKVYLDGFDVTSAIKNINVTVGMNMIAMVEIEAHLSLFTLDGKRIEGGSTNLDAGPTNVSIRQE